MCPNRRRCAAAGLLLLILAGSTCCAGSGQDASGGGPSPQTDAARMLTVRVEVVGQGKPLSDVQVELYQDRFEPIPGVLVAQSVTGEDGIVEFEVAAGSYGLWPRALNMSSQWQYTGPTRFTITKDRTIRLEMKPAY